MTQTYREEQEVNVAERIMEDLNKIVDAEVFSISESQEELRNAAILERETRLQEDQEEHECDRDEEEVSEYECDEERYN